MVIDKAKFELIREELEHFEENREHVIKLSREIIQLSKRIIYGLQRNEDVKNLIENIKTKVKDLPEEHYDTDIQQIALQEYVEALCFYGFIKNKQLPSKDELNVNSETYLLGLCDMVGELVRQAVNSVINKRYNEALEIKSFVEEFYNEVLKLNLRNGQLRKKVDSVKWNLKNLEELALNFSLK